MIVIKIIRKEIFRMKEKLILAYSGGLDTSVAIAWLKKPTM